MGVGAGLAAAAAGQPCGPQWLPGEGLPGTNGVVNAAVEWDPDGAGPAGPVIVVGGNFSVAGDALANGIAAWDPVTNAWSSLGAGVSGSVSSLAVAADGSLVVGGSFSAAGGVAGTKSIARWDGSAWTSIGGGVTSAGSTFVHALAAGPGGTMYAGGVFGSVGGVAATNIASWNGSTWAPMGSGVNQSVLALAIDSGGAVLTGGTFTSAGGQAASRVAKWDGVTWAALGAGLNSTVNALAIGQDGSVFAGGLLVHAGSERIARWDGAAWLPLSTGLNSVVLALELLPDGSLLAAGDFTAAGGVSVPRGHARWNGSQWSAFAPAVAGGGFRVHAVALRSDGSLFSAGDFTSLGGRAARNAGIWDGTVWHVLGDGLDASVTSVAAGADGRVAVGGNFRRAGGVDANAIALWDGVEWTAVGTGLTGASSPSNAQAVVGFAPNGDLFASGQFFTAGGVSARRIARWNGDSWSALGLGLGPPTGSTGHFARAMTHAPSGDLVVGGAFNDAGGAPISGTARWDGTSWSALGSGPGGETRSFAWTPAGNLIAAIGGGGAQGGLRVWDGFAWATTIPPCPFGSSLGVVARSDGRVFAASTGLAVAELNAGQWNQLIVSGNGGSSAFASFGDDVVLAGSMSALNGVVVNRIARWDGAAWVPLGAGFPATASVNSMAMHTSGELLVGGDFYTAGDQVSAYFARWTDTNIPWIAYQPDPQTVAAGATAWFSARPANGYLGLSATWEMETSRNSGVYAPLTNGPIDCGAGAAAAIVQLEPTAIPGATTLTITGVNNALHGRRVRAVIGNACGTATTHAVTLDLATPCPADLTESAAIGSPCYGLPNGAVTNDDFFYFLSQFASGNLAVADVNKDGVINSLDFFDYLNLFVQGCQ